MKIAIVHSEFNSMIVEKMLAEAKRALADLGVSDVSEYAVPGAVEIPLMIQDVLKKESPDAVIALGLVVRGETAHFEHVNQICSSGIARLMLDFHTPIVFEVLMTENYQDAEKRISKGYHAAEVAVRMAKQIKGA